MMQTLELKFEDEFQVISDLISRKASLEDLQFYRKEASFKADKDTIDDLRQECLERLAAAQNNLKEKDQYFSSVADSLEQKLDDRLTEMRNKTNQRLDEIGQNRQKELMNRIVSLSEQLQNLSSDTNQ